MDHLINKKKVHCKFDIRRNPRGFNGSVNIPESCDFRSQFDPIDIICEPFLLNTFFCWHMHFK